MSSSACFSACEYDRRTHQAAGGRRALSATLPSVRRDDASTYLIRLWVVRVANDDHMFDMLDPSSRTVSIVEHPQLGPMPNGPIHSQPTITHAIAFHAGDGNCCITVGAKHVVISSPQQLWTVLSATRRLAPNDHSSHLVGMPTSSHCLRRKTVGACGSSEPIELQPMPLCSAAILCSIGLGCRRKCWLWFALQSPCTELTAPALNCSRAMLYRIGDSRTNSDALSHGLCSC
jgi:hypothetical protein